jgi:C-terminal processing protease CtpA/Prc
MKIRKHVALALSVLAWAGTASAGKDGKCEYSTQECLDYMATKMKGSGWVGVELDMAEGTEAMRVTKIVSNSPAEGAGIQAGDLLVAINGITLGKANEEKLMQARSTFKPGDSVTWTMKRGSSDREVAITLAPMPADVLAAYIGQHMLEHAQQVEVAATNK